MRRESADTLVRASSGRSKSWDESFLRLRRNFLDRWPARLEALLATCDLLQLDPRSAVHLASLGRAFHALTGAAGSYGFADASAIARSAEVACQDLVKSGATLSRADLDELRRAVEALEKALSHGAR